MKTENQRMLQRVRNSDLRAAKAWRGQQRATYPRHPSATFSHSPGDAAQRAVIREGRRLTDSRIAIFEAPEREPGRQQVRREARKEAKRRLGPPATVAARQLRFYKAGLRAQQAA